MDTLQGEDLASSSGRLASCKGKASYSNRKEAARAASRLKKRLFDRTGSIEPIHAYHCTLCHHCWHVGHPQGWRREFNVPRPAYKTTA